MKHVTGKTLIFAISLVLTVALGSGAYALNFDLNDDPYPNPERKAAAAKKKEAREQKRVFDLKSSADAPAPHGGAGFHGKPCAPGWMGSVDKETAEKLKAERNKFLKETRNLRLEIKSKQLAIQSEIVKPTPDVTKAMALQTELSGLEAQLGQKRLVHQLEMQKLSPMAGTGCMNMKRGCRMSCGGCPMMAR